MHFPSHIVRSDLALSLVRQQNTPVCKFLATTEEYSHGIKVVHTQHKSTVIQMPCYLYYTLFKNEIPVFKSLA